MQASTYTILDTTLRTDSTISPAHRKRILDAARSQPLPAPDGKGKPQPRIFSRVETAKLLGDRTTRFVDQLCRKGLLKKFTAPGSQRAIGVTAESFNQFLEGVE